jgi:tetratricopeptide (TPR) repeat protein
MRVTFNYFSEEKMSNLMKAVQRLNENRFNSAITQAEKELKENPICGEAFYIIGQARFFKKEYESAIDAFTAAITVGVYKAYPFTWRGLVFQALGEHDNAISDFTQSIALDADYTPGYTFRAQSYAKIGEMELARKDTEEVLIRTKADEKGFTVPVENPLSISKVGKKHNGWEGE